MNSLSRYFLNTTAILWFTLSSCPPIGAQQTALPDLNRLEPPCGQPLIIWKADDTMDEQAFHLLTDRISALPPGFYKDTQRVYSDINPTFIRDFADRMTMLFDGKHLKKDVYQKSMSRFKSIPKVEVEKWAAEMRRLTHLSESDSLNAMLAWELTAIGTPYVEEKYSTQNAQKYLSRLKQLLPDSLDLWSDSLPAFRSSFRSSDKEDRRIDSAFTIVQIDAFFPKERFNIDKLKNAIDNARKARSSNKSMNKNKE